MLVQSYQRRVFMKKLLLFALAISLGGIAFAADVDCSIEENCHCNFFSQEQFYGIKGCHSCPVRENGRFVKCEKIAATNHSGEIDRDCCWLNTPHRPEGHPWSNCYTNAYVLNWGSGSPWSKRCIKLLDGLVSEGSNGGTGTGGTNGNAIGHKNPVKVKPTPKKPSAPKPAVSEKSVKSDKQVQPSDKKAAK